MMVGRPRIVQTYLENGRCGGRVGGKAAEPRALILGDMAGSTDLSGKGPDASCSPVPVHSCSPAPFALLPLSPPLAIIP